CEPHTSLFHKLHFHIKPLVPLPLTTAGFPSPDALSITQNIAPTVETFISRFAPDEPRKGCDVLVEALEREGVTNVFAYPGGTSMEIHQALTRSRTIRNVLPRHEQGGIFAAEGYARATGFPGVCMATSGPGATNLVTGLADALLDSVPIVAITGQVPRKMIGTDAFQETPIVELTRSITKHNYLVMDVQDCARGVLSSTIRFPDPPNKMLLEQIVRLISESKKPVFMLVVAVYNRARRIPVASTLMGLGAFPTGDELSLQMLGMH
uniref:Acetolactate synthase 2, chloroplastic-like n=1 Tax=Nicotiana sylvestris TaxID=4096 RepID=A0A1U7Y7X3_NICSY